jgi:hypothetical protein
MMMRKILQDTHHCSGSDTLLGSANVGASIFILLLLGFVGGSALTLLIVWVRQKKQRKYDMAYRDRYRDKALGDIPDVDGLIKSARFVRTGEHDDSAGDEAQSDQAHIQEEKPGPLQGGSAGCLNTSIEFNSALLRSRKETLSQVEEVKPSVHERALSNVTDPESPLPNIGLNDKKDDDVDSLNEINIREMILSKRIGSEIHFEEGARLDGSASFILNQKNESMRATVDPPFQNAWETSEAKRNSVDQKLESEFMRYSINSVRSVASKESGRHEDNSPIKAGGLEKNPFATTKEAIDAAKDALDEMKT